MELPPKETERRKVGQGGKKENMRKQWNPEEKYWVYKMLSGKCEEPKLSNQKLVSFPCNYHFIKVRPPLSWKNLLS